MVAAGQKKGKNMQAKVPKSLQATWVATGKKARAMVFSGNKLKTKSGLTKANLVANPRGKIVGKKARATGKKAYKRIAKWSQAVSVARKVLGIKGFQAVGGLSAKGQALLKKARSIRQKL